MVGSDSLLLCDSGGQYDCGTTDVTRTHHTGTPTAFQKEAYTRVLQGHIALASVVLPGHQRFRPRRLRALHLWAAGLDYRHGTGHGVGAALNVHEGPQSISPRFGNPTPLRPGNGAQQRAGILRGRRVRHSHREPAHRARGGDGEHLRG